MNDGTQSRWRWKVALLVGFGLLAVLWVSFFVFWPRQAFGPKYADVCRKLLALNPIQVNVSPNGRFLLAKTRSENGFTVSILDRFGHSVKHFDSSDSQLSLTWCPNSKDILYLADRGGDRNYRLFEYHLDTGSSEDLAAPAIHTAALPIRISQDGRRVVLPTGDANRVILATCSLGLPRVQWTKIGAVSQESDFKVSPDGKNVAFVPYRVEGALEVRSLADPKLRPVKIEVCPKGQVHDLAWSPDASLILCTARAYAEEYFGLIKVVVATRRSVSLVALPADIERPWFVSGASQILFHVNRGGLSQVALRESRAKIKIISPDGCSTNVLRISQSGAITCLIAPTRSTPYLADLDIRGQASRFLPNLNVGAVNIPPPQDLVIPRAGTTPTHAYVWRPRGNLRKRSGEAVIYVHGGPHLQESPVWNERTCLLLNRGFTVAVVNYRGSTGYGRDYERAEDINGQAGDIVATADYIVSKLGIEARAITLVGESSGSIVAIRALSAFSKRVKGIVLISPSDLSDEHVEPSLVPRFVLAYQGENDPLCIKAPVKNSLSRCMGADAVNNLRTKVKVFESEGHQLRRIRSWATVYSDLLVAASST